MNLTTQPPPFVWSKPANGISLQNPIRCKLDGDINSTAYATVLDSCSSIGYGKQVHAHLLKNGFHMREFVGTKLMQMYGKCGSLEDVVRVFDKMPDRNLYTYTAILNLCLDNRLFHEAFIYFEELLFEDVELEFFVFPVVSKICGGYGGVELGRQIHGMVLKIGVSSHNYVGNSLIDMYGKCGSLDDAKRILSKMSTRDCVSWNSMVTACAANGLVFEAMEFSEAMSKQSNSTPNLVSWSALISGFAQNGYDQQALDLLYKMRASGCHPNARILASILPASARLKKLRLGKEIYGYITRHGFMSSPYVVNGLVDLYRRIGDMESAYKIFLKFSVRDEVSYNTMIAGYCDNGMILKAKELFDRMEGEGVRKDLITWNTMISGFADNFRFTEALRMFTELIQKGEVEPDSFTLGSALGACADSESLLLGEAIHSYCIIKGLESNLFVSGALVDMYCRCQELESAEIALQGVQERDIVIWNALISGYSRCNQMENMQTCLQQMRADGFEPNVYTWNGIIAGYVENDHHESALQLVSEMQASKVKPDIYTVGIVLPACSRLATIERGKQIHAYAIRCGFESDAYIVAALIDMYAKCGTINRAKLIHSRTNGRSYNLVTQNAMLNAYAMHGYGEDGIAFFRDMLMDGCTPDNVTFLAVLSSCVHAGAVDTGVEFFDLMGNYGVTPTLKHYTCMVDLLSRAGELKQACKVIDSMPMNPDTVLWAALLNSCVIHGDMDLGEMAASKLFELEPNNSANYVMLANLYASTARWHRLKRIRKHMKDEQMQKNPGCSWIEDKDETHVFMAFDLTHKRAKEIYDVLDNLTAQMKLKHV
ncbi:pentatricopeptide repeat-containing protein At2g13600-like [Primulina eburnea]|uniref:pentatricopeptide repeat-containing protein At2g13600-like n=1 Tax=Primulina eburnea TaxID=1245227 RepID=UPI003C6CA0B3